ncbi:MAG: hypothetical protein IPQ09_14815 [Myxococcales bacterium]|nr:hypothetical protein [Myxococcales bacterium]
MASANSGTIGTHTSALSFEYSPNSVARNTSGPMAGSRVVSASSASRHPNVPNTSEMPTTPLTASVSTAEATRNMPASHETPFLFVTRHTMRVRSAPFAPWKRTFTQW